MKLLPSLFAIVLTGVAQAEENLPKLELGVALSTLSAPDYRGSDDRSLYVIPFPYIKYRSERFRVDDGAKGMLLDTENWQVSLSGNFTLPVDEDTSERDSMDELDPILEVGPSVNYRLQQRGQNAWWVEMPLRFAYTLDSDFEHVGYVFNPRLTWRKTPRRIGDWKLKFNIGPLYASDRYHQYFYSVDESEARPDRPAYDAEGGFSGMRHEFTLSKRFDRYWFGGFLRYDNLRDAEIEDSPLVSNEDSWVAGIGFGYVFFEK